MSQQPDRAATMAILGEVLETLRLRGSLFLRADLGAPWGVDMGFADFPRFHISVAGDFYLGTEAEQDAIVVPSRTIILLPGGMNHWIADRPGRALTRGQDVLDACALDQPMFRSAPISHRLICGRLQFDEAGHHPLLDAPPLLHVPAIREDSILWRLVQLIESQIDSGQPLSGPVVDRLVEVMFLHLLGEAVSSPSMARGFLAALRDRRLARVLKLLHHHSQQAWTLERLATESGMSRSTLVRQFGGVVGVGPVEYLNQWRLMRARHLVMNSGEPVETIAGRVGFASGQSLTKAFKRRFGESPRALRTSVPRPR